MGKNAKLKAQRRENMARLQQTRNELAKAHKARCLFDETPASSSKQYCVVVNIDNVATSLWEEITASGWWNSQFDKYGECVDEGHVDIWDKCIRYDLAVKPPYESMFFEWQHGIRKVGVHVVFDDMEDSMTVSSYEQVGGTLYHTFDGEVLLTPDGKILKKPTRFKWPNDMTYPDWDEIENEDYDEERHTMVYVFTALALINCRNVVLVENVFDREITDLYEKHYGEPVTKFKTLSIRGVVQSSGAKLQKEYQSILPLHLRRGNFATYTDDAPLLGKFTGTFWRPATVVGNAKNGVVVKDYKVSPE